MPQVIYVSSAGKRTAMDVPKGENLMQAAADEGVDGIVGECGGNAMCATCHVYVDEPWLSQLPPLTADEDALLDGVAAERRPDSRLSCQVHASDALDGIVVHTPERQT